MGVKVLAVEDGPVTGLIVQVQCRDVNKGELNA